MRQSWKHVLSGLRLGGDGSAIASSGNPGDEIADSIGNRQTGVLAGRLHKPLPLRSP